MRYFIEILQDIEKSNPMSINSMNLIKELRATLKEIEINTIVYQKKKPTK